MTSSANGEVHSISVPGETVEVTLRRRKRRTLAITVRPDRSVVVTAPLNVGIERVVSKVRCRALWIKRQQRYFAEFLPLVPSRKYVSGETHRYLGRQFRLRVLNHDKDHVKLVGRFIHVHTRAKQQTEKVRKLLDDWYLGRAREVFTHLMANQAQDMKRRLAALPHLRLRKMPKRWGSCTRRSVYLNPELVRAPKACIEYVIAHELCHLVYPNHGREFYRLLRTTMPDWEIRKARLERIAVE